MSDTNAGIDTGSEIWLDGFAAGAHAALEATSPGQPEVARDSIVEDLVQANTTDPAFLAAMRAEVADRLGISGVDPIKAAHEASVTDLSARLDLDAGLAEVIGDDL